MGEVNRCMKTKKVGQRAGMPRRVREMSKEVLEATLRKKKECNSKAFAIVEQLLENTVNEDWFLENLKYINDSHFQDVVEERAISKLCGYPLCCRKLSNVPNQQFHISTKLNKVYDITERKNYCSNQCYKAGKFIKDQLLTSPLWLRDREDVPSFTVLPHQTAGCGAGEEVDLGQNTVLRAEVAQLKKIEQFTSISQFAQASLSHLSKKVDEFENHQMEKHSQVAQEKEDREQISVPEDVEAETMKNASDCRLKQEVDLIESSEKDNILKTDSESNCSSSVTVTTSLLSAMSLDCNSTQNTNIESLIKSEIIESKPESVKHDIEHLSTKSKEKKESPEKDSTKKKKSSKRKVTKTTSDIPPMTNAVIHLEKCLNEWFTINTLCFLFGDAKVKEMVADKGEYLKEYYKAASSEAWDRSMQERYAAICRRLDLLEIKDEAQDNVQLKPLPDYSQLQANGQILQLKVNAFYQGKTSFEKADNTSSPKEEESSPCAVLPLVDLHAQNALRRRIVLDRLNRVLPDLLRTFGLSSHDFAAEVRLLVRTFALGANNITFKPAEWSLIGLIVIKMLAIKDIRLKILLDTNQANKYLTMMLMSFQLDGGYLERLMTWITDIDNLLHK